MVKSGTTTHTCRFEQYSDRSIGHSIGEGIWRVMSNDTDQKFEIEVETSTKPSMNWHREKFVREKLHITGPNALAGFYQYFDDIGVQL